MGNNIISDPSFQARLLDLEYKELESPEFEEQFKQIYLEETGQLLEGDIQTYNSKNSSDDAIIESGYNGTAIYINNGDKEELYIVSQGSQDSTDWLYNIKAMLAGRSTSQALATDKFVDEVKDELQVSDNAEVTGFSHSLAHNNNTVAYLNHDTFDQIYSINGAQTNYYQQYFSDRNFQLEVRKEFSISSSEELYNIPPQDLHDFALNFYEDKVQNIHQTISEDDPLYGVSAVRGFFTLGSFTMVDTNPEVPGIRDMMENVPDEVVKNFQDLAIDFTVASNKGGTNAGIEELIGVNPSAFEGLDGNMDYLGYYFTHPGEVDSIIRSLNDNVPSLLDRFDVISANKDTIFGSLYEAGYISKAQRDIMVEEIAVLDKEINEIMQLLERNVSVRDTGNPFASFGGDIALVIKVLNDHLDTFKGSMERIQDSGVLDSLHKIGDSHGIPELLSAISEGNKSYLGTDMVYTSTKGDPIKVNISASLRLYREGTVVLEEKLAAISKLEEAIHQELAVSFKEEKTKVVTEINQIEASPASHASLLEEYKYPLYKVKSVRVNELFLPLKNADLDEEIDQLKKSAESGYLYIETYRKAIEDLFQEEDNISQLFDFSRRI